MLRMFWALIGAVVLVSCVESPLRSAFKAIDDKGWHKDSIMQFTFKDLDTLQQYNMFLVVRNDNTYAYSNLFLIATLTMPDGNMVRDTLEYEMAKPSGEWLGNGYGSLKENKLWYKENLQLPSSGAYTLEVMHAMRKNGSVDGLIELEGITDVGYQIEKSNR
ncbi:gliding motility lipoprotein GldH [Arenibacter nanhaiticus]|nr:gliding motility lipoprotein GldH [Arenibacter nanhaiticus]